MLFEQTVSAPVILGTGKGLRVTGYCTYLLHPVEFTVCNNDTVPELPAPHVTSTTVPVGEPLIIPPETVHEFEVPATNVVE